MFKHTKEFASEKSVSRVCIPVMMFVVGLVSSFDAFGIYYSNPEINRLIAEKQAKMAQLETCTKKVKGFKIAGISTIGLTTVGVGANIVMASKESQLSDELERARGKLN
ncbi:MAG: hypothetical protein K5912_04475, partial [Alphaproteobacteria bacterium]|nr:hypothetical protein [Alphaproteobacteria bacterium]